MIQNFSYKEHTLEYIKFGTGSKVMLAFHGFGRNCKDWLDFEPAFGTKYTIYSFNLFFHGNSVYNRNHYNFPLEKSDIAGLVTGFCKEHKIEKFALLAYSLGGKIALTCIEQFENRITAAYLFAPDGVVDNWWYELGAKTIAGQWVCRFLIFFPQPVLWLARLLKFVRLIDNRILKFVKMHMSTKAQRKLVFDSWIIHRRLTPKLSIVKQHINLYQIPLHVFVGKYDKIITPKIIRPLSIGVNQHLYFFTILTEGHNLIKSKTNNWLAKNYMDKI